MNQEMTWITYIIEFVISKVNSVFTVMSISKYCPIQFCNILFVKEHYDDTHSMTLLQYLDQKAFFLASRWRFFFACDRF